MSVMHHRILTVVALSLASCGGVMLGASYQDAVRNKDYPALQKVCLREVVLTTGNSRDTDVERACEISVAIANEKKDTAFIDKACNVGQYKPACNVVENDKLSSSIGDVACADVPAQLGKKSVSDMSEAQRNAVLDKLISCGSGEYIFEKIAHVGDMGPRGMGVNILKDADKRSNGALLKVFTEYATNNTGAAFLNDDHSEFGANHIGNWLSDSGHNDLCKPLTTALTGSAEKVRANILFYLARNKCKEGLPIATELLASNSANFRALACTNLANFGDKTVLKKVKTVAETDTYFEVQENGGYAVKVYPVADACKEAYGKIQLRSE